MLGLYWLIHACYVFKARLIDDAITTRIICANSTFIDLFLEKPGVFAVKCPIGFQNSYLLSVALASEQFPKPLLNKPIAGFVYASLRRE